MKPSGEGWKVKWWCITAPLLPATVVVIRPIRSDGCCAASTSPSFAAMASMSAGPSAQFRYRSATSSPSPANSPSARTASGSAGKSTAVVTTLPVPAADRWSATTNVQPPTVATRMSLRARLP